MKNDNIITFAMVDLEMALKRCSREQALKNLSPSSYAFEQRLGGWFPLKGITIQPL